jgi:nitroimidazol reductase NimA-like FMN-containing flavoprotein (pyridoxamine 5'-phosphate oxidase superfamily)
MLSKLDKNQIEDVLKSQIVGRIGCHADGVTYVVPISYAYDGADVYARTDEGMKLSMMRKNPRVCFQVDTFSSMANWKSVIIMGEFKEITDEAERHEALEKLAARRFPVISSETVQQFSRYRLRPQSLDEIEGIVFRITPYEKSGRYEDNGFNPTAPF